MMSFRPRFTVRIGVIVVTLSALVSAWLTDRTRLQKRLNQTLFQLLERDTEIERLKAAVYHHDVVHAKACLEVAKNLNGPFQRVATDIRQDSDGTIETLSHLGVVLYEDRHGAIVKADVPDTTNFREVFEQLNSFPSLRFIHFVTGPLLPNCDWNSDRFRSAYSDAVRRPILRTQILSSHFRQDAFNQLRSKLPHVEATIWAGAF